MRKKKICCITFWVPLIMRLISSKKVIVKIFIFQCDPNTDGGGPIPGSIAECLLLRGPSVCRLQLSGCCGLPQNNVTMLQLSTSTKTHDKNT
jgi:hypothetical protein